MTVFWSVWKDNNFSLQRYCKKTTSWVIFDPLIPRCKCGYHVLFALLICTACPWWFLLQKFMERCKCSDHPNTENLGHSGRKCSIVSALRKWGSKSEVFFAKVCYYWQMLYVSIQVVACLCPEGFSGMFCGNASDACQGRPCYRGVTCQSKAEPEQFTCGECPDNTVSSGKQGYKCFEHGQ